MKKNKISIVIILFVIAIFYSCQDNVFENPGNKISNNIDLSHLGTFPLSDNYKSTITRATTATFDTDWENYNMATLASGLQINLP